jgi:hypothetical protein
VARKSVTLMVYVVSGKHRDELPSGWELAEVHGSMLLTHLLCHAISGALFAEPSPDMINTNRLVQTVWMSMSKNIKVESGWGTSRDRRVVGSRDYAMMHLPTGP